MKERPILFSGEMVRAILDGRKTQTRRIVKMPIDYHKWCEFQYSGVPGKYIFNSQARNVYHEIACPYGNPGDRLWVCETWDDVQAKNQHDPTDISKNILYRADFQEEEKKGEFKWKWTSSIHMPRWASRIDLEIIDVRVERLQDISNQDIRAEGVCVRGCVTHRLNMQMLWDSLNEKRGFGWDTNPWVWVVEFRRK